MAGKYLCAVLVLIVAYYSYTVVKLMQLDKSLVLHHNEGCKRVESDLPSEDIIVWRKWIIGATADAIPMYYKHLDASNARPGYLLSVDPETKTVSKIETQGIPSNLQLNAHGLTIHSENILYVISHSYSKGEERLFRFELSEDDGKVKAKYLDSLSFGSVHANYNGIAVVNSTHFYVTQWIPFPDQPEGRDNSFLTTFHRMSKSIYTQSNPVRLCQVTSGEKLDCFDVAFGYIPNGILLHNNQLFFADSIGRTVDVFDIKSDLRLTLVQRVPISHTLDNLCAVGSTVYVTGVSKLVDYVLFGESVKQNPEKLHFVPGGFSKVEFLNGKWRSSEVIMQDLISLPSSVAITGKTVTFTSIIDGAFVFCPLPSD